MKEPVSRFPRLGRQRLPALLLVFAFPEVLITAENLAAISFFRAIQDKALYAKNPAQYRSLVVNDQTGKHEYYVEKQASHAIPKNAIRSVSVKKIEKYTASGERFRESEPRSESKSRRRDRDAYELIFNIRSQKAKNFTSSQKKTGRGFSIH